MPTTPREIALLRLAAQRVIGPGFDTASEVVRHLTAMQGQDLPGVMTSTAMRTKSIDRALVIDAMNAGEIVRSWPMRGTLHLTPAEDLGWMLALTARRVVQGATRRREQLGIDTRRLEQAAAVATESLNGGRSLRREELMRRWDAAGLLGEPGRGYHLLFHLSQTGLLCFGPFVDGAQSVVLLAEWVSSPPPPETDEALGEWVRRYFRSHGPATVRDFAWWTKLTMAQVRIGLAIARSHLAVITVDEVEYLMDPGTPARLDSCRSEARDVLLLPGFDEFVLGYTDRSAALPTEHANQVVPGNNGMFRGTVIANGRVVGTWKQGGTATNRRIDAEPFTEFDTEVAAALPHRFAALPR